MITHVSHLSHAQRAGGLLLSLEETNEKGEVAGKADIFSKRTIKPKIEIDRANTSAEALNISINQKAKVDMGYMMSLTGFSEGRIVNDLKGVIYRDLGEYKPNYANFKKPFYETDNGVNQGTLNEVYAQLQTDAYDISQRPYVTSDEYLSGNVKAKYRTALALSKLRPDLADEIKGNIEALEKVQPETIPASDISVNLGATWIHKDYIQSFMKDLFRLSFYAKQALALRA